MAQSASGVTSLHRSQGRLLCARRELRDENLGKLPKKLKNFWDRNFGFRLISSGAATGDIKRDERVGGGRVDYVILIVFPHLNFNLLASVAGESLALSLFYFLYGFYERLVFAPLFLCRAWQLNPILFNHPRHHHHRHTCCLPFESPSKGERSERSRGASSAFYESKSGNEECKECVTMIGCDVR